MATYSTDEAKKRYESLPSEIKNLIYSPEMSFTVQQIGQKNKLHIDQIDSLNTEIGQVMLGFVKTEEFLPALMEMLGIERAQADSIAKDVNDMLFLKIRESMKKVAEMGSMSPTSSTPVTPTPVSAPVTAPLLIQKLPEMHSADLMLTQKTASVAPAQQPTTDNKQQTTGNQQPPKPQNYKADPYREPVE